MRSTSVTPTPAAPLFSLLLCIGTSFEVAFAGSALAVVRSLRSACEDICVAFEPKTANSEEDSGSDSTEQIFFSLLPFFRQKFSQLWLCMRASEEMWPWKQPGKQSEAPGKRHHQNSLRLVSNTLARRWVGRAGQASIVRLG